LYQIIKDLVFRNVPFYIEQGMIFIEKTLFQSHGSLRSSNCLIDSRWVLKVSGFGLVKFKEGAKNDEYSEFKRFEKMLWTAPELLRLPENNRPPYGTVKGDIYAFGIILQEVIYRTTPYFGCMEPKGKDYM